MTTITRYTLSTKQRDRQKTANLITVKAQMGGFFLLGTFEGG